MTEETEIIDLTQNRTVCGVLGGANGLPRHAKFLKKVRVVHPMNHRITDETTTFDPSLSVDEIHTLLDPVYVNAAPFDPLPWLPHIGDTREFWADAAGGADSLINFAMEPMIIEVLQMTMRLQCGNAAANRTMQMTVVGGGYTQRIWAALGVDFVSTVSGAVIINQYGSETWLPNGLEGININGAIVMGANLSPLPMKFNLNIDLPGAPGIGITTFATNCGLLNVLDFTGIQVLVRRVA